MAKLDGYMRGYEIGKKLAKKLSKEIKETRKTLNGRDYADIRSGFDDAVRDSDMANV